MNPTKSVLPLTSFLGPAIGEIQLRETTINKQVRFLDFDMTSKCGAKKEPNQQLWDSLYQDKEDEWTSDAADDIIMKFSDLLTQSKANQNILVPLCGKSKVMFVLAEQGHTIVGIEWSKPAIVAFFDDNELAYQELFFDLNGNNIPMFRAIEKSITIYCGEFLSFNDHTGIGPFDCILDHGAIVTFAPGRSSYAAIINSFTKPGGKVLLSIFDYDHFERPSIPFAVTEKEVNSLFKDYFKTITLVEELDAKTTAEIYNVTTEGTFQVLKLSRMSWKIMLMVKN